MYDHAYCCQICAGTLVPDVQHLYLRPSPGFCNSAYGAVEDIDWRNSARVGALYVLPRPRMGGCLVCTAPAQIL